MNGKELYVYIHQSQAQGQYGLSLEAPGGLIVEWYGTPDEIRDLAHRIESRLDEELNLEREMEEEQSAWINQQQLS